MNGVLALGVAPKCVKGTTGLKYLVVKDPPDFMNLPME